MKPLNVQHDELIEKIRSVKSLDELYKIKIKAEEFKKNEMAEAIRTFLDIRINKKELELMELGTFKRNTNG